MTCNEALDGIEKSAAEGVEVNSDLNKDLNLELATGLKESGTESLVVGKVGLENQNTKVGTKEAVIIDMAKANSEIIQVEKSEDSDQFVINQMQALANKPGGTLFESDLQA